VYEEVLLLELFDLDRAKHPTIGGSGYYLLSDLEVMLFRLSELL
jgi:hypothetical protein